MAGKFVMWLSRSLGQGSGSSLPGMVALRICPGLLEILARQIKEGIIVVTGTNGKTTTSNMLADILSSEGQRVVTNRKGANLATGVASAFLQSATVLGRLDYEWAVLEVDEAAFPFVYSQVKPQAVVVTNFFRDQLDRYGELDATVDLIKKSLLDRGHAQLILNADDPLVAGLAAVAEKQPVYYGLGEHRETCARGVGVKEARFCPHCSQELNYAYYHYSQLGAYSCPRCGFARPVPALEAINAEDGLEFVRGTVIYEQEQLELTLPTGGLHNLYNAVAALAAATVAGISPRAGIGYLRGYHAATGRMDRFRHRGRLVLLNLVKNPAGFNRGLAILDKAPGSRDVLIAINDNDADGRDVSWLWDVDFEILGQNNAGYNFFICSGRRGEDMAVRLKYAGVPADKIKVERNLEQAVDRALGGRGERVFLLATYTALWPVELYLRDKAERVMTGGQDLPSVS
jgi:UDP-N-acetylmuramyl tripeptide synthase